MPGRQRRDGRAPVHSAREGGIGPRRDPQGPCENSICVFTHALASQPAACGGRGPSAALLNTVEALFHVEHRGYSMLSEAQGGFVSQHSSFLAVNRRLQGVYERCSGEKVPWNRRVAGARGLEGAVVDPREPCTDESGEEEGPGTLSSSSPPAGEATAERILMDSETCVQRIRVFTAGSPLYGCRYRLPANRVWSWTPLRAGS
jgi:hypothetical protein